jgi:hypothetical protein
MTANELQKRFQEVMERTVDGRSFLRMELRDRMAVMAKLGRELILNGIGEFFVAAVVTASDVVFPANVISDDHHKQEIKRYLVDLASKANALCVIVVMEAWGVKATPENFQPHLPHSLHPNRQEVLVVNAKDYFEHLAGIQIIQRSEGKVDFGDLQVGSSPKSWLDEWQAKAPNTTVC